jgi:hypothetical protein
MPDLELSALNTLIVETIIDDVLYKLNKDNTYMDVPKNQFLLYLCSLVLEKTKESLLDNRITSEERVLIITEIISALLSRLPISDALKKVFTCFIKDGEIQKILVELEEKASRKCMGWFGKIFRACMRSSVESSKPQKPEDEDNTNTNDVNNNIVRVSV